MIYISKGIVQEKSTERNIYVARCGQVFHLTKVEAQLWLDGRDGFFTTKNAAQERALQHLYRMGLVEFEEEDTLPLQNSHQMCALRCGKFQCQSDGRTI